MKASASKPRNTATEEDATRHAEHYMRRKKEASTVTTNWIAKEEERLMVLRELKKALK